MHYAHASRRLFLIVLTVVLLLCGCETVVEVDIPEHTPVLVANSFFTPEEDWQVELFRSRSIFDNDPHEHISNATVEILEDDVVVATLGEAAPGIYQQSGGARPQAGHTYTLRAEAPGLEGIEATDSIPTLVEIQDIDLNYGATIETITIHFADPPDVKNYYQISIIQEMDGYAFPIYFETDDLIFETQGGIDAEEAFFDDALIAGQDYGLKLRIYPAEPADEIYVLLLSVSESYYNYMQSTKDLDDNPFVEPMRAYTNITNGFGIFAGFSISAVRLI